MHRAWQLRSAWAWRSPQRKPKRSGDRPATETAIVPETAIGVGGEEARDLISASVLNLGVIAGGVAAPSIASGGNAAPAWVRIN